MAERHVHCVAVADEGLARRPWGVVSTLDIAAAVGSGEDLTAGEAANRSRDRLFRRRPRSGSATRWSSTDSRICS